MRSKSIVVLVNPSGGFSSAPEKVRSALADPALGANIPRLAVFDPAVENKLGALSYQQIKAGAKPFREINRAIKEGLEGGSVLTAAEDSASATDKLAPRWDGRFSGTGARDWTSAAGTKIRAEAVRFDGSRLTLKKPDGGTIQVSLQQLDEASRTAAQQLIDAARAAGPGS